MSQRDIQVPADSSIQLIVRNDRRLTIYCRCYLIIVEQRGDHVSVVKVPYIDEGYEADSDNSWNEFNEQFAAELELNN